MTFIADRIFDLGLAVLTDEADTLHLCTNSPEDYEQAADYSMGFKLAPRISSPEAGESFTGRQVTIGPVTEGQITRSGEAMFWALVDSASGAANQRSSYW